MKKYQIKKESVAVTLAFSKNDKYLFYTIAGHPVIIPGLESIQIAIHQQVLALNPPQVTDRFDVTELSTGRRINLSALQTPRKTMNDTMKRLEHHGINLERFQEQLSRTKKITVTDKAKAIQL